MASWQNYVSRDPDLIRRMVTHAFKRNPNISSFPEFQEALFSSDPADNRIERITPILDDFVIKDLFESEECKARVRQNISEEEFTRSYEVARQQEVIREKPIGEKVMPKQVMVITIPKPIKTKSYVKKSGIAVKDYSKSYRKWQSSEIKFIKVRKVKEILTPKQVAYQFNEHFKGMERSESSIKTKFYRLK
jgi:hypothetical protein